MDKKNGSPRPVDAESTDVSKADVFSSPGLGSADKAHSELGGRPSLKDKALYDWSEVAYLFEDGQIPHELL